MPFDFVSRHAQLDLSHGALHSPRRARLKHSCRVTDQATSGRHASSIPHARAPPCPRPRYYGVAGHGRRPSSSSSLRTLCWCRVCLSANLVPSLDPQVSPKVPITHRDTVVPCAGRQLFACLCLCLRVASEVRVDDSRGSILGDDDMLVTRHGGAPAKPVTAAAPPAGGEPSYSRVSRSRPRGPPARNHMRCGFPQESKHARGGWTPGPNGTFLSSLARVPQVRVLCPSSEARRHRNEEGGACRVVWRIEEGAVRLCSSVQ